MTHNQVQILLSRTIEVDELIAGEIILLNKRGVITEGCCQGPPPTALILPSSVTLASHLGYEPIYRKDVGFFEIILKTEIPLNKAKEWDKIVKFVEAK